MRWFEVCETLKGKMVNWLTNGESSRAADLIKEGVSVVGSLVALKDTKTAIDAERARKVKTMSEQEMKDCVKFYEDGKVRAWAEARKFLKDAGV